MDGKCWGNNGSEPITVQWSDIGFPVDHSALLRMTYGHEKIMEHLLVIMHHPIPYSIVYYLF